MRTYDYFLVAAKTYYKAALPIPLVGFANLAHMGA